MRAYTLAILSKIAENNKPIQDSEIIDWVNSKVRMIIKMMNTYVGLSSYEPKALKVHIKAEKDIVHTQKKTSKKKKKHLAFNLRCLRQGSCGQFL